MLSLMRVTKPHLSAIVLLVFVVVLGAIFFFHNATSPQKTTRNSPAGFTFEIVATTEARVLGLSGRSDIPEDYGMLFVFDTDVTPSFWMKDMLMPIDIIWISKDREIVSIDSFVEPTTYPNTFSPPTPIRYVLETRAGEADRQGWEPGMKIWLPK